MFIDWDMQTSTSTTWLPCDASNGTYRGSPDLVTSYLIGFHSSLVAISNLSRVLQVAGAACDSGTVAVQLMHAISKQICGVDMLGQHTYPFGTSATKLKVVARLTRNGMWCQGEIR